MLDLPGLAAAYEWLTIDKLVGLRLALEWYDNAREPKNGKPSPLLYLAPLDAAKQKLYDMAVKVRGVGDGTPYIPEKITFFEKAIRIYEQIWSSKGLLKIDEAGNQPVTPRLKNIQTVLGNFNQAFGNFMKFRVTANPAREYLLGEILLTISEIEQAVNTPPLQVILAEAVTVAKAGAMFTAPDGTQKLNGQKFVTDLPLVMTAVYNWAAAAEAPLKPMAKIPAAKPVKPGKAAGGVKAPRAVPTRIRIAAIDPFGIFKADTIKAAISQLLSTKQIVTFATLQGLCKTYGVTNGPISHTLKELESKAGCKFSRVSKGSIQMI